MGLNIKEYTAELWAKVKSFISSNYSTKANTISGLTVSGKVITYTKGDGSTGTITTQDTNTTYSNMTAATASAAGKAGLVPAPAAGKQASFLRGDGTWVVPTNTTYSFSNKAATLAWNTAVTVATVGGVDITVKLPANPNTNTTYSAGSNITLSGTTFSLTKENVVGALGYTPPTTNTTYSKLSQFTNDSGYITSSGSCNYANSAGEAAYMGQHNTINYGVNRLQYYNVSTSATSGPTTIANPTNDWYYHLRMSHANNNGYYGDVALCFHQDTLAFRRIVGGSDQGWTYLIKQGKTIVSGYEVYVG